MRTDAPSKRPPHGIISCPCVVDGQYFENTRLAHRALFLDGSVSYFQLQRALKRGDSELFGHSIERVKHQVIACDPKPERKPGEPLLRYPPGEGPLDRGITHWR